SGGSAQLWDATTEKPFGQPLNFPKPLNAVAFSSNGKLVATASGRSTRLWDPLTGNVREPALRHPHTVNHIAFSADGEFLATAMVSGGAQLWKTATGLPHGPVLPFRRW